MAASDTIMATPESIPEFYAGRSILITGATGFLGKVLMEKLLRSCPEVKNIYLLIRPKKGKEPSERLEEIVSCKLFDKLRTQQPDFQEKLVLVPGDMFQDGLGIDQSLEQTLINEVSLVFHSAATIKFDEAMKLSVEMNVVAVRRMLALCKKMKKLESFIHISTAYANCDRECIEEEVYPPPLHPDKLISAMDWMDAETLNLLTPKMLGKRPNTYTYTKAVAEYLVKEESGSLPVVIFRPSIVGATCREPVRGWVDNFNGATGVLAAIGKGILRIMKGDFHATADLIPVDLATNMMIAVAWSTATHKPYKLKVYNCTTGQLNKFTWGKVERMSCEYFKKNPVENVARVPNPRFTKNVLLHDVRVVFDHMLPAYMMDFYMWICGRRRIFVRLQDKLQKAVTSVDFFTSNSWDFKSDNMLALLDQMSEEDRKTFGFHPNLIHWSSYMEWYCLGTKQFVLKEELSQLPAARKALARLQKVNMMFNLFMFVVLWRILVKRVTVARVLWNVILGWAVKILQKIPGFAKSS